MDSLLKLEDTSAYSLENIAVGYAIPFPIVEYNLSAEVSLDLQCGNASACPICLHNLSLSYPVLQP